MWSWLLVALLYVLGMGFFRWLGGIETASQAIQRWGHLVGERRRHSHSPSG